MLTKQIAVGLATSMTTLALVAGGTLVSSIQPASAATIITEYTGSTFFGSTFPGQSVTTSNNPLPWNNITFNWFSDITTPDKLAVTDPTAFGTLFLLSQEYLGTPDDLSPATSGFLAQSQSISGGQYIFDPGVTLQPNTEYFFYTNASGTISGSPDGYPGGKAYFANGSSFNFFFDIDDGGSDNSFRLSGTPIPTPALLPGLIGMGVATFRKRRTEAEAVGEKA
jgi:hypothetical protein